MIPDAEVLVRNYLAADAGVSALVEERVYTHHPANPTYPLVVLFRFGGATVANNHLDTVRIQIEAWADTSHRPDAAALFHAIREAMKNVAIRGVKALGVVTGSEEVNALWLPDPATGRPRYIVDSRVFIHESPAA